MKRINSMMILFLILSTTLQSQDETKFYQNLYSTADSLILINKIEYIDSTIFLVAYDLDQKHPSEYFKKSGELLEASKFNEASFIFNLGILRYSYYISVNPEYEMSGDGALLSAAKYTLGRSIDMYLKTDLNNFISICKKAVNFYELNEFKFYKKNYNREKFCMIANAYYKMIEKIQNDREGYISKWKKETIEMKESIKKIG